MSAIFEIAESLQDTQAALLELEKAVAAAPMDETLLITRDSLQKRQQSLESEFAEVAHTQGVNVCSYRLFSEQVVKFAITSLANALRDFQGWFTVVMDRVEILIAERDEFKRMHADIVETITVIDGENTVLRTKLDEALKTIDELNEAAIDDII